MEALSYCRIPLVKKPNITPKKAWVLMEIPSTTSDAHGTQKGVQCETLTTHTQTK
ncbi:MAG: hypothetical protein NUV67_04095 [archaeon]|nr:hypothetical protein [archaeon]